MRRSHSGFRGKFSRPHEPLIWERVLFEADQAAITSSNTFSITVFDPTGYLSEALTQELTVRRLILQNQFVLNETTVPVNIPEFYPVWAGVLLTDVASIGAAHNNPAMLAAEDQRRDWMWMGEITIVQPAAAAFVIGFQLTDNKHQSPGRIDIKLNRKMHQDERLVLVLNFEEQLRSGDVPAGDLSYRVLSSCLFQRTLKR